MQDFIAGTNFSLTYLRLDNGLVSFAHSDADWAGDVKTTKFGFAVVIKSIESDLPAFWRTANQRSVSLATKKTE